MTFEDFLSANGFQNLTQKERKGVYKEYRKIYFSQYHKERRKGKKRVDLRYDEEGYKALEQKAKEHDLSIPQYVKRAVQSYEERTFILQDPKQLRQLEFLLIQTANSVAQLSFEAKRSRSVPLEKFKELQAEIRKSREYIKKALAFPPTAKRFLLQQQEANHLFLTRLKTVLDNLLEQQT